MISNTSIPRESGVVIRRFMSDELGLSGMTLSVYALLYSFTKEHGNFYGSREYIAYRLCCSLSSVERALKELKNKGLLYKTRGEQGKLCYAVTETPSTEAKTSDTPQKTCQKAQKRDLQSDGEKPSNCGEKNVKMTYNEKEMKKNTTTSTVYKGGDEAENSLPHHPTFRRFGAMGLVVMTGEQHARLCDVLGDEIAENYIYQLEAYLSANPTGYLKNHYKTILKWAKDDSSC